ncbi:MAG: HDOD domain-containing protein [Hydrogenophilales bacterium]|nr:HDOD domain-containing protein [Hydrogenophilales bacterium]
MGEPTSYRVEALVNEVDQLLTLPAIYVQIKSILDSPDSSIIEIAKAISMDVALTAKLLRIVNSPIYAQSRPVETVTRAVSMLGINQIHDLCLACCLADTFAHTHPSLMDVERFWRESLQRAISARDLARKCGILNGERLFVLGLLSDIGHMVMFMRIPEMAAKLFLLKQSSTEPIHLIERRHLDFDFAQVSGALLRRWRLPSGIYLPIEQHSAPRAGQSHAIESALLHLVSGAIQAHDTGTEVQGMTTSEAWEIVGLPPEDIIESLAASLDSANAMRPIFHGS